MFKECVRMTILMYSFHATHLFLLCVLLIYHSVSFKSQTFKCFIKVVSGGEELKMNALEITRVDPYHIMFERLIFLSDMCPIRN